VLKVQDTGSILCHEKDMKVPEAFQSYKHKYMSFNRWHCCLCH